MSSGPERESDSRIILEIREHQSSYSSFSIKALSFYIPNHTAILPRRPRHCQAANIQTPRPVGRPGGGAKNTWQEESKHL